MQREIEDIVASRWFRDPSPFRCRVDWGHPRLTVITGDNASGKSLLRKILSNEYRDQGIEFIHTSQTGRARSGIERMFIYGSEEDDSTGFNSVRTLLGVLRTARERTGPVVIMLDEPEIGCSDETAAALGQRLARDLDGLSNLHACYVVSHSRCLVRPLLGLAPTHWRLSEQPMSLEAWVDRPVSPEAPLEGLVALGRERWRAVQRIVKEPQPEASA